VQINLGRIAGFAYFHLVPQRLVSMSKPEKNGAAAEKNRSLSWTRIVSKAIGKVTGDTKVQAEGIAEKAAGKVQSGVGEAKDGVRNVLNK
jgi:hypothetical protein